MSVSLLNGCALVVDDEIFDNTKSASKIVSTLESEGTLFIKRNELPAENMRGNLSGISFIILDWDIKRETQAVLPEGVQLGSALRDVNTNDNISFINNLCPVCITP